MVKVDKATIDHLSADWVKPIDFEDDETSPQPKSATDNRPTTAQIQPTSATDQCPKAAKTIKNKDLRAAPSKQVTGVDPKITEICASLSQQIYGVHSANCFNLETSDGDKAEVLIFDDGGEMRSALPAFAVAMIDSTLIMGWRGSRQDVMDWVNNAAMAPVICSELGTAASGVRSHAMHSACVGSNLHTYQDEIISIIKKRRITEVVFTGHSLGGGLAKTAHVIVQAQVSGYNKSSPWDKVGRLKLRAVTFAGVMSTIDFDELEESNPNSEKLLNDVGANSVNFVFGADPVPRGYGHINYIKAVINKAAPEAIREINIIPFGLGTGRISKAIVSFALEIIGPLVPVAVAYRHTGKLIYYHDKDTKEPRELVDTGPAGLAKSTDPDHLNHYDLDSYKIPKKKYIETFLEAHSHFPMVLAPYIISDNQ